jgi:hypothetical protein
VNEPQFVLNGGALPNINLGWPHRLPICESDAGIAAATGAFVACKGLDQQTKGVERKGETRIKQMPFVTLMNFNPAAI